MNRSDHQFLRDSCNTRDTIPCTSGPSFRSLLSHACSLAWRLCIRTLQADAQLLLCLYRWKPGAVLMEPFHNIFFPAYFLEYSDIFSWIHSLFYSKMASFRFCLEYVLVLKNHYFLGRTRYLRCHLLLKFIRFWSNFISYFSDPY